MSSNPHTCINIVHLITTFFGTFTGVIAGAFLNNQYIKISTEKHFFKIASNKFRSELMPFYHEISEVIKENSTGIETNINWSLNRMRQIIPVHRKIINEFRFSIPSKHLPRFNGIVKEYIPEDNDKAEEKYFSDTDTKAEMSIRKEIKARLESIINFSI